MENVQLKDPKDEQIINKDESVTNKDGDSYLEKGSQPTAQKNESDIYIPTVTPDNDNGDPGPPAEDEQNKDPEKEKK